MLGQEVLEFMNIPDRLPGLREQNLNLYRAQRGSQAGGVQRPSRLGGCNPLLAQCRGPGPGRGGQQPETPDPTQLLLMSPGRSASCQSSLLAESEEKDATK